MGKRYTVLKNLVFIIAAAVICMLYARAGDAAFSPGERAMKIWGENLNPSKQAIYLKFRSSADTGDGKENVVTTMAIKGKNTYVDIFSDSKHISTITDTEARSTVILLHDEQMYMKMPNESYEGPNLNDGSDLSEAEKVKMVKSSGKEKIAGRTYDYEKITVDGNISQTYYFEEGTDKWKYWRTADTLMEIIEYGNRVDENLFKIPKGYSKMMM
ncbi:MAG: hypothetical protein PHO18_02790 [Synergistaceae bacterium]|nr:hypothetical protein [Synergistaceae bacterium]